MKETQGKRRKINKSEETEEVKTFPLYPNEQQQQTFQRKNKKNAEVLLMSTNNICFCGEIRIVFYGYSL